MTPTQSANSAVNRSVPMVFASDVDASIAFYKLLGFEVADRITHAGRTGWAWLTAGKADLMLACADEPIDPAAQAILLYMYTSDVSALRADLLRKGITDGGPFGAKSPATPTTRALFDITRPFHMPDGELRVHDPDGHCLLIGQPNSIKPST